MRRKVLLLLCVSGLVLIPGRDASAFWKYLGELSGPGYWMGTDFIFPWSLSSCDIEEADLFEAQISLDETERVGRNIAALRSLGLPATRLDPTLDGFLENPAQCKLFVDQAGIFLPPAVCASADGGGSENTEVLATRLEGFVRAWATLVFSESENEGSVGTADPSSTGMRVQRERVPETAPDLAALRTLIGRLDAATNDRESKVTLITDMRDVLGPAVKKGNARVREKVSEDCRDVTRRYGAGPAGLFGSSQALPQVTGADGQRRFNNFFISLALGIAVAARNELDYGVGFEGDRDAIWLSAHPAIEKRFFMSADGRRNVFVNVGPSLNYFVGSQFEDFLKVSARARAGVRIYPIQFGGEIHAWGNGFRPSDFGALGDELDGDSVTLGFFFSVELGAPPPSRPRT